jgi:hypothetical protein
MAERGFQLIQVGAVTVRLCYDRGLPCFFFHLSDSRGIIVDSEGRQFASFAAARAAAESDIALINGSDDLRGLFRPDCAVVIADESRQEITRILFSEVTPATRKG